MESLSRPSETSRVGLGLASKEEVAVLIVDPPAHVRLVVEVKDNLCSAALWLPVGDNDGGVGDGAPVRAGREFPSDTPPVELVTELAEFQTLPSIRVMIVIGVDLFGKSGAVNRNRDEGRQCRRDEAGLR